MNFQQKLDNIVKKNNSLLCVGLDPVLEKLPKHVQKKKYPFFEFNKAIIDATHDLVCCYKPNSAFYEAYGEQGIGELKKTCDYIKKNYSEVPILLDFKRGDIGNTNKAYAAFAFDYLKVDAVTLQPYQGMEALQPFLEYKDKGIFILCKTSNPGSNEFQDVTVILNDSEESQSIKRDPSTSLSTSSGSAQDNKVLPLYLYLVERIVKEWNRDKNLFVVVGATYPIELQKVRKIVGDMTLLIPGIGAQGGDIETSVKASINKNRSGIIISTSRVVLYAGSGKDFDEKSKEKAIELRDTINQFRN